MSNVEQRLKEFRQKKEEGKKRQEQRQHLWNLITLAGVRNRWRNANSERTNGNKDNDSAAAEGDGGNDDGGEFLDDDEDAALLPQTPIDAAILIVKVSYICNCFPFSIDIERLTVSRSTFRPMAKCKGIFTN